MSGGQAVYSYSDFTTASKGEYFSTINQVFGPGKPVEFAGSLKDLKRPKVNGHYRTVLSKIGLAKDHTNARSRKESIIKSDKLRKKQNSLDDGGKEDLLGLPAAEDAHAVPDSPTCAPAYGPIVQLIAGVDVDELPLEKARSVSGEIDRLEGNGAGVVPRGGDDERKNLVKKILKHITNDNLYAVKNLLINKTRIVGPHKTHYDTHPRMLMIPCVTLEYARGWSPGHEYHILIVCEDASTYRKFVGISGFDAHERGRKATEASPDDLNMAQELMTAMLKGLADSCTSENRVRPIDLIDDKAQMEKVLSTKLSNGTVDVPARHVPGARVLKVKLENRFDYEIPDPMLLAMKAAINWYYITQNGLKLLPACIPLEDPREKEIRIMNEELCDELREEELHPATFEDLARGLGQGTPQQNRPARVSLSPEDEQFLETPAAGEPETHTTDEWTPESWNREMSPCELYALYDEIDRESETE